MKPVHWMVLATAMGAAVPARSAAGSPLTLRGTTVTPHLQSTELRYRREPDRSLGARVQWFLEHTGGTELRLAPEAAVRVRGKTPGELLAADEWAWHDFPDAWPEAPLVLRPGDLTVWSFNGKRAPWGVGTTATLALEASTWNVEFEAPEVWLSAVTFLGEASDPFPDRLVFHVVNASAAPWRLERCRLWWPREGASWRALVPQPWRTDLEAFPANGVVPPGDRGGAQMRTGRLPLTYAALEVQGAAEGRPRTLWAHLRVKREAFDIGGGWVASRIGDRNTLECEPYLKTLRRLHVNAGMHDHVPGYTDHPTRFEHYPLKYMNRCQPFERFDTETVLPRIHAVEFLGEPQYGGGRPVAPMEVWRALAPYQATRLPTSVTHSEERIWRFYAGLSDYPHYDAYRVSAPSPDLWSAYDRWSGERLRWGAPLETIGDMTRSLRELSRPGPIAYWSQGPHAGWGRYGGRRRTSPTPEELRVQAYHALSSRITSLYWFNLSLESLVKFRDLLTPLTHVGREIRLLAPFLLEGDAAHYARSMRADGGPDWDVASVCGPRAALLFALDLDYRPDPTDRVFKFAPPRAATWDFPLPSYLRDVTEVFRLEATGIQAVAWTARAGGVKVSDRASQVAVYVATADRTLRDRLEAQRRQWLEFEANVGFDPAARDDDFAQLRGLVPSP